jgi:hypothetical protein
MGNEWSEKTIEIPVELVDGQWRVLHGLPWPRMRQSGAGTLSMPAWMVEDPHWRHQLLAEPKVDLLPASTWLRAELNPKHPRTGIPDLVRPKEAGAWHHGLGSVRSSFRSH